MAKRGLISSGAGGSGVNSYIDLENRPDDIIDTTVIPAGTTAMTVVHLMVILLLLMFLTYLSSFTLIG
jgi:hypothetical protein